MRLGKQLCALASIAAATVTLAAPAHADVDTDFANQLHGYGIYGPRDYNAWLAKITCERLVTYGYASGPIPPINLWEQPHGVRFVFIRGDAPEQTIDQWRQRALQVMHWIEDGTLDVLIDRTYPLEDAASAHRDLESQDTVGKLLLIP
jgi:Zinc-binding dehydrogenase